MTCTVGIFPTRYSLQRRQRHAQRHNHKPHNSQKPVRRVATCKCNKRAPRSRLTHLSARAPLSHYTQLNKQHHPGWDRDSGNTLQCHSTLYERRPSFLHWEQTLLMQNEPSLNNSFDAIGELIRLLHVSNFWQREPLCRASIVAGHQL